MCLDADSFCSKFPQGKFQAEGQIDVGEEAATATSGDSEVYDDLPKVIHRALSYFLDAQPDKFPGYRSASCLADCESETLSSSLPLDAENQPDSRLTLTIRRMPLTPRGVTKTFKDSMPQSLLTLRRQRQIAMHTAKPQKEMRLPRRWARGVLSSTTC